MSAWQLHPQLAADTTPALELPLCDVRLMDDANYPWLVLVPRVAGITEIIDLEPDQRAQLTEEIDAACRALRALFTPDKLNVAALGNMVPQLHVHVIARYRSDVAWPRPVWGAAKGTPYEAEELVERVSALQAALRS